jgi:hypothetical protein
MTDTERLDWLEKHLVFAHGNSEQRNDTGDPEPWFTLNGGPEHGSLRAAIDAAVREAKL